MGESIFSKAVRKVVTLLTRIMSYESFALMVIETAKIVFKGLVELLTPLVMEEKKAIDELKESGASEEEIEAREDLAALNVTKAVKAHYSASPSWIPTPIAKIVQEAVVYITNLGGKKDERDDIAREKGFFREYTAEEYKEVIDRLNKGWGNR